MSQTTYKSILSIQVSHTYFKDTILSELQFAPAASLATVFREFGIVFKQTTNGFQLYAPSEVTVASLLAELQNTHGITAFSFNITVQDPTFYNYTDLPINWVGSMVFSSADPQNEIEGNLTKLHPSFHEIENNNLLGNLHIAFNDILAIATNDTPSFAILFNARATQWCYYLVTRSSMPLNGLHIANDVGIQFSDPVDAVLQNGETALLITSNVLIPLADYGKYNFELKFDGKMIKLPNASADSIEIVESDGAQWVASHMYVYI